MDVVHKPATLARDQAAERVDLFALEAAVEGNAALAGMGIVRLPDYMCAEELSSGGVGGGPEPLARTPERVPCDLPGNPPPAAQSQELSGLRRGVDELRPAHYNQEYCSTMSWTVCPLLTVSNSYSSEGDFENP